MNLFLYVIELFVNMFKSNTTNTNKKVFKVKVRKSTGIVTRWDLEVKNYVDRQYTFSDDHIEVCNRIVDVIDISISKPLTDAEIVKICKTVQTQYRNKLVLDNCVINFI